MPLKMMSFFGIFAMIFFAWIISENKKKFDIKAVFSGIIIQFILAAITLKTEAGLIFFSIANDVFTSVIQLSDKGAEFVFGKDFKEHFFAFSVLPTIIFISSLSYLLFYWGVIQKVIGMLAFVMKKTMGISPTEGFVSAANVFCGQTEAPLFIKPYLATMTISEINTMMTAGMATISGGILAAFVGMGVSAGHLITASLMSAPAAIVISKIIRPEEEKNKNRSSLKMTFEIEETNAFEAACKGATQGLSLALNVGAVLIAFVSLMAFFNLILGSLGSSIGYDLTLEKVFGYVMQPIAFLMGIEWKECFIVGQLLGEKIVANELVSYVHLVDYIKSGALSERSIEITTYALCGFANFSSIAIQIGGIGSLEPSRRKDFVACAFKAMLGGCLASFITACIAGVFL